MSASDYEIITVWGLFVSLAQHECHWRWPYSNAFFKLLCSYWPRL